MVFINSQVILPKISIPVNSLITIIPEPSKVPFLKTLLVFIYFLSIVAIVTIIESSSALHKPISKGYSFDTSLAPVLKADMGYPRNSWYFIVVFVNHVFFKEIINWKNILNYINKINYLFYCIFSIY